MVHTFGPFQAIHSGVSITFVDERKDITEPDETIYRVRAMSKPFMTDATCNTLTFIGSTKP